MKKLLFITGIIIFVIVLGYEEGKESGNDTELIAFKETTSEVEDSPANEASSEIEEITEGMEKVNGTEFETPAQYEHYFEGEILADLEKLPLEIQEYIRNGASVHIIDPFVHDEEAREILIEAYKQVSDLNPNDVDALISEMIDENISYEERLEKLVQSKNK
mgnify:CR=1 FL=1